MNGQCDWTHCRKPADIGYQKNSRDSKKEICQEHWEKFCDMQAQSKENDARKKIGLPPLKITLAVVESAPVEVVEVVESIQPIASPTEDSELIKPMKSVRIPKGFL